jgi:hypothetical protein
MEFVEETIENGLYNIYLPRDYYIQMKILHGNTGKRYYLCTRENNIEAIHGILYFGIAQKEHKIRFNPNTIIETIIKWPIYYTEENYFTVITIDYKTGSLYRLIRIEGKESSKKDLVNHINIFSTLKKNENIIKRGD